MTGLNSQLCYPQTNTPSRCLSSSTVWGWPKAANPLLVHNSLPAPVQWAPFENFTLYRNCDHDWMAKKYPIFYHWGSNYSIFWTWFASRNNCQLSGTVPWDKFEPTNSLKTSYAWSEMAQLYKLLRKKTSPYVMCSSGMSLLPVPRTLPWHIGSSYLAVVTQVTDS